MDVEAVVGTVSTGSVSGVQIDDGGTNYEIGDVLTFTDNTNQSGLTQSASGRVAVVHGSIILEDSLDNDTLLQDKGNRNNW